MADADADAELDAMVAEWSKDAIMRVLDRLWCRALDSRADNYIDADGNEGELPEDMLIRFKTNSLRVTRQELDELYRQP